MSKSQEKNQLFFQNIFNKIAIFFKKYRFLEIYGIFSDCRGSSRHFDYLFTCLGLIINESTISNIVLNSRKIMKIMSTLYFETPLIAK